MKTNQEEHLRGLIEFITTKVDRKYRHGAVEHDSDLFDLNVEQLCLEAIDESLDQITYLYTLLMKIRGVTK